jgi:hypothetical protein
LKVYIGCKKAEGKYKYGLTIYSEKGALLHSSTIHKAIESNKFDNVLDALEWGIKKLKVLSQNKVISEDEGILLVIGSKTLYTWFEKDVATEPYTKAFSSLLLEMSFILNRVEIIHSVNGAKKVLYRSTSEDNGVRVADLFK